MKFLKHLVLGAALFAAAPATAQVNSVAQTGVIRAYAPPTTYSAGFIGLVPAAATTDLLCIAGSATKTIYVQSIRLGGSGTAISVPATLLKRATADTGGTAATTTANPANNISKRDSGNAASTATVIAYTANPTINDATPTYIDSLQLGVVATTVGAPSASVTFNFASNNADLLQPLTLRGVAEQACVNLNGTSATALLSGSITWIEQ